MMNVFVSFYLKWFAILWPWNIQNPNTQLSPSFTRKPCTRLVFLSVKLYAGVAGRKKKKLHKKPSLQRKNTIFGSRPRVERRLTSSTAARGSSRMFYRSICI